MIATIALCLICFAAGGYAMFYALRWENRIRTRSEAESIERFRQSELGD